MAIKFISEVKASPRLRPQSRPLSVLTSKAQAQAQAQAQAHSRLRSRVRGAGAEYVGAEVDYDYAPSIKVTDPAPVSLVPKIISSLDPSYFCFVRASQLYTSAFFEGESHEFKVSLIKQLNQLYPNYSNTYWDKMLLNSRISLDNSSEPIVNIAKLRTPTTNVHANRKIQSKSLNRIGAN